MFKLRIFRGLLIKPYTHNFFIIQYISVVNTLDLIYNNYSFMYLHLCARVILIHHKLVDIKK
ncbi:hypothetical protein PFNF135_01062 [Plasmodium falciparum NF135/5.C10]|uniref:Uncharacterized protein n=2 Tax=Plasmodium falciparum TaxID=5833 RepID=A0A024WUK1_PLAFA|nr:hypothetical protein PFNF135_01062 [Plasmodium falciparum NF135/5.C10]ETW50872.1 hypothetical protein PFMALIP_01030 [Plasmodium falciparum MaliPS096_E11]